MRHILAAALCCLGLCAALPASAASPAGNWQNESGVVLSLDENGRLAILTPDDNTAGRFGLDWKQDGNALVFRTVVSACSPVEEGRMDIVSLDDSKLVLRDMLGNQWTWTKAPEGTVKTMDATLYYMERMMLPPRVYVGATLSLDSGKVIASVLVDEAGRTPLNVRVHYLASRAEGLDKANFSAGIVTKEEGVLFSTQESVAVELESSKAPEIRLIRSMQDGPLCPAADTASLSGVNWKLLTLNGKDVVINDDQAEPTLLLSEDGKVSGCDGCNNYFMQWEVKGDGKLAFLPGGATMKMCPEDEMRQAEAFMKALLASDGWALHGDTLALHADGQVIATFKAVHY